MKWIVIGWILGVIGVIYPAIVGAMLLASLSSELPVDVNWGLFTICCLIGTAGFMLKDKGKKGNK